MKKRRFKKSGLRLLVEGIADNMAVCEARRSRPRNNGRGLDGEQIRVNVCRSLESLKHECRVNRLLFVFTDGNTKSIAMRVGNLNCCLWLDNGNRHYGAVKIMRKHLIDGGVPYTGGFTLAELNRDINNIVTKGNVSIDENKMTITWASTDGFRWNIVAFKAFGNRWTINTIYTSRSQSATRAMTVVKKK